MRNVPRNSLDLKQSCEGELRYLDGGAGGFVVSEEVRVDLVHGDEVVHVCEEDLSIRIKTNVTVGVGVVMMRRRSEEVALRAADAFVKIRMLDVVARYEELTVVLITFPNSLPPASTTAFKFFNACAACASTPPSTYHPARSVQ